MTYREQRACRSCGSERLTEVLNLGSHALSGFKPYPARFEEWDQAPLVMVRCENCTLVQLGHTANRDLLYAKYWYKSGTNESMVAALRDVVADMVGRVHRGLWLDIGANDGTLLALAEETGHTTLGVDPVPQHPLVSKGYFPEDCTFEDESFVAITSIAQFYNVENPNAYVAAIKRILHPEGVWMVQMQDLQSVYVDRAFDYICHEHLCLWEPFSFDRLLAQHGLEIADVSYNSVNGGSVRITVMHGNKRWAGKPFEADWQKFHDDVVRNKLYTVDLIDGLHTQGKKVAAIAASTKGNTTLQYYGIGPELVPYIGDRNPEKVGTFTPTGQLVVSEDTMRALQPDYLLTLAWHFLDSFKDREAAFLERGGKFILPLPEMRVVGADAPVLAKVAA